MGTKAGAIKWMPFSLHILHYKLFEMMELYLCSERNFVDDDNGGEESLST